MTGLQLRNAMSELKIKGPTLAHILNVHVNTVSRWRSGKCEIPGPVAAYVNLRLAIARIR
jgi:DNA-binding transcriptional regulator YiaG